MSGIMEKIELKLNEQNSAPLFMLGEASSSLDIASALYQEGKLPLWGSVLVEKQTKGRGQRGHSWHSEGKNLYAALRLPMDGLFSSEASAPIIGTILAESLRKIYCDEKNAKDREILLKWTNDILLRDGDNYYKIAGMLLEEKNNTLFAGIGININSSPNFSEIENQNIEPSHLSKYFSIEKVEDSDFSTLWGKIVSSIYLCYSDKNKKKVSGNTTLLNKNQEIDHEKQKIVLERADTILAFKNKEVKIIEALPFDSFDYDEENVQIDTYTGILRTISSQKESLGGIIIDTKYGRKTFINGRVSLL